MKQTMVELRKWRDNLKVDTPIITREAVKGIIIKLIDDTKCRIMHGKAHEKKYKIEDLFPIEWEETVIGWVTKKHGRDPDIPIN